MWDNETIVLVVSFKKRILSGKDKVRYSKIFADSAIPPFIKNLFQKRLEKYLTTESPFIIQPTPHFDLSQEDIDKLGGRFLEVLREVACFRDEEVESILREALVLRLDFLVKPVDTMRKILFDSRTSIEIRDMEKTLEPFSRLLPYAEQLIGECKRLGYKTIEPDEYGNLISDIIQNATKEDPIKNVLHDFSVTTDYLSETKGEEISRVEGQVLQEFLADRNLWSFRRALDVEMKLGKEDFDSADLEMIFKRYQELKEAFLKNGTPLQADHDEKMIIKEVFKSETKSTGQQKSVDQKIDPFESLSLKEEKIPSIPEPESDENQETWDLNEVLAKESPILEFEGIQDTPAIQIEEKPKPVKSMRIIRREQKEEEPGENEINPIEKDLVSESFEKPETRVKQAGLKQLIDDKTEKVFIKKLFNGDASSYEKLLGKLDEAESWRVAKILIDNELFKRDVDPFSREAIKLVDLIYSRYYPEEGIGGGKT